MTQLVLVVDDVSVARQGTVMVLRLLFRYAVDEAVDGFSAIDKIRNRNYAAILMDIDMPEMDGYECTKQIREMEKLADRRTPIIGMTAHVGNDVREKCLASGMDDYLDKAYRISDLRA